MCTREEVRDEIKSALKDNNKIRDDKWENRFSELKLNIQESFVQHIQKTIQHLDTSPNTNKELNRINNLCATRGQQIINMEEKIESIDQKLDKVIDKLDTKYALKDDVKKIQDNITWIVRLVFALVITSVVALVIKN